MTLQTIRNRYTGEIIFQGAFDSIRACAEQAVREGYALDSASLAYANLVNAQLDEASLRFADLQGANLSGANLSEACLDQVNFSGTLLVNACLCYSSAQYADFTDTLFGATDIAGTDLSHSLFSTLSALSLNFVDARAMTGCCFASDTGVHLPMTRPPLVLHGLPWPIAILDTHVRIGGLYLSWAELRCHTNDNMPPDRLPGLGLHSFIKGQHSILNALLQAAVL